MLSHEDLATRPIWVFKQPRTGSHWFTYSLGSYLKREPVTFDEELHSQRRFPYPEQHVVDFFVARKQQPADVNSIIHTHHFYAMESLKNYKNPIIFFTARKNATEQIISAYVTKLTNIFNLGNKNQETFPKLEPFVVPIPYALEELFMRRQYRYYWSQWCNNYEHEIVYYEDILEGWTSKIIPVSFVNVTLKRTTAKLPYDKRELVINYDELDKVCKENS